MFNHKESFHEKSERYAMLDRLGCPNHKNPRWCSDHEMDEPLKSMLIFITSANLAQNLS